MNLLALSDGWHTFKQRLIGIRLNAVTENVNHGGAPGTIGSSPTVMEGF